MPKLTSQETISALKQAHGLLSEVIESNHTAFASPSPSSSEAAIRKNTVHARNILDITLAILRV